jgi:hypothetical protein
MLAEKWQTNSDRIEFPEVANLTQSQSDVDSQQEDEIQIDELQKAKNGKLTVHFSRIKHES